MKYVHYGSAAFDKHRFEPIRDRHFIKPNGGLWGSPVGCKFGWKEWCLAESFHCEALTETFTFEVAGMILKINSFRDAKEKLVWVELLANWKVPLFEPLLFLGVDAIHLTAKGQRETRFSTPSLYGWDCESILVLNPKAVRL